MSRRPVFVRLVEQELNMHSRVGILMGLVLVAGMAAPGCGGRPIEAPVNQSNAQTDYEFSRAMAELSKAGSPTVLTIDGQSFLSIGTGKVENGHARVDWQMYRYENGRFVRVEVLENPPPK